MQKVSTHHHKLIVKQPVLPVPTDGHHRLGRCNRAPQSTGKEGFDLNDDPADMNEGEFRG